VSASAYGAAMDCSDIVTVQPGKRGGKPVIRRHRVTVDDVLSYLAAGLGGRPRAPDQNRRLTRRLLFDKNWRQRWTLGRLLPTVVREPR